MTIYYDEFTGTWQVDGCVFGTVQEAEAYCAIAERALDRQDRAWSLWLASDGAEGYRS